MLSNLCVFNASVFQNGNDVTKDRDSHVSEVVLGQLTQHVRLDPVLSERHSIVTRIRRRNAGIQKELEPHCGQTFASF